MEKFHASTRHSNGDEDDFQTVQPRKKKRRPNNSSSSSSSSTPQTKNTIGTTTTKAFYCNLVVDELCRIFHINPIDQNLQHCEFPLVCSSCSDTSSFTTTTTSGNTDSTHSLEIHPRVFDPTLSFATLPFVTIPPQVMKHWKENMPLIGKGSSGHILQLPISFSSSTPFDESHEKRNYVVKIQLIEPLNRKHTDSWSAPIVEFEQATKTYVTYEFVMEAIAMYALNRYESQNEKDQTHPLLFPPQTRIVPRIYYSAVFALSGHYYSAIVMDQIENAVSLYTSLITNKISTNGLVVCLKHLAKIFEQLETSALHIHHQDIHSSNVLLQYKTVRPAPPAPPFRQDLLFLIDWGTCMLTLPLAYLCSLTTLPLGCVENAIPMKTNRNMRYVLPEDIRAGKIITEQYYNLSVLRISLVHHMSKLNKQRKKQNNIGGEVGEQMRNLCHQYLKITTRLWKHPEEYDLPSTTSSRIYFSPQFEKTLLAFDYPGSDGEACASSSPTGCTHQPARQTFLQDRYAPNVSSSFSSLSMMDHDRAFDAYVVERNTPDPEFVSLSSMSSSSSSSSNVPKITKLEADLYTLKSILTAIDITLTTYAITFLKQSNEKQKHLSSQQEQQEQEQEQEQQEQAEQEQFTWASVKNMKLYSDDVLMTLYRIIKHLILVTEWFGPQRVFYFASLDTSSSTTPATTAPDLEKNVTSSISWLIDDESWQEKLVHLSNALFLLTTPDGRMVRTSSGFADNEEQLELFRTLKTIRTEWSAVHNINDHPSYQNSLQAQMIHAHRWAVLHDHHNQQQNSEITLKQQQQQIDQCILL